MRRRWSHGIAACGVFVLVLLAVGCSSGTSASPTTSSPTPTSANRPASPAKLSIVSPRNGQVVHGTTVEMKVHPEGREDRPGDHGRHRPGRRPPARDPGRPADLHDRRHAAAARGPHTRPTSAESRVRRLGPRAVRSARHRRGGLRGEGMSRALEGRGADGPADSSACRSSPAPVCLLLRLRSCSAGRHPYRTPDRSLRRDPRRIAPGAGRARRRAPDPDGRAGRRSHRRRPGGRGFRTSRGGASRRRRPPALPVRRDRRGGAVPQGRIRLARAVRRGRRRSSARPCSVRSDPRPLVRRGGLPRRPRRGLLLSLAAMGQRHLDRSRGDPCRGQPVGGDPR